MKVLIIRLSSIGDIVLTTPVVRAVKQQLPEVCIHYLTRRRYGELLSHNPHIDRLYFFDRSLSEVMPLLKQENYDVVIDLHRNLRTARVKIALGTTWHTFPKLNLKKWILVNLGKNLMPAVHIVDRYFEAVKKLGVRNDGRGLEFHPDPAMHTVVDKIPPAVRKGYAGIVLGAQHKTKCLPEKRWIELLRQLPLPSVLLGGSAEKAMGDRIASELGEQVFNACGILSLGESANVIREAQYIITHDTGLMHIAAAMQKPVAVLWGSTVPAFGMYPYYPDQSPVQWFSSEVQGLSCRPCSKIGFDRCPKGHFRCMMDQDLGKVLAFCRTFNMPVA